ncbi:hypothetical protein PSENEW3_00004952 [Picochlorum sp. SENEW3]|nr:hypothetical protein PSENEW3_00004952 [Picochlorum sp. SENEW3]
MQFNASGLSCCEPDKLIDDEVVELDTQYVRIEQNLIPVYDNQSSLCKPKKSIPIVRARWPHEFETSMAQTSYKYKGKLRKPNVCLTVSFHIVPWPSILWIGASAEDSLRSKNPSRRVMIMIPSS